MIDKNMTREQLIHELAALRRQVAETKKIENERKQAEEALNMARERLNFLLSHSPATIFTFKDSGDFRTTFMSENITAQLGYQPGEFLEDSNFWANHVHPEDLPRLLAETPRLFQQGQDTREYRMRHKDGTYLWVHEKIRLVRDESGDPLEGIGSGIDITDRKQMEEMLQKGKEEVEIWVVERTAELRKANEQLHFELSERKRVEGALRISDEESKKLAQENAVMAEIGRIISSTLNIEEIYELFIEEVRKLIQGDRITISIANPDGSTLTLAYAWGVEIAHRKAGCVFPFAGTTSEKAMQTRSSILTQGKNIEEVLRLFPGLSPYYRAGFQSMIVVPLISKNNVIGVLHFRSLKPMAYNQSDVIVAERVGNQIAGAIDNARLFAKHKQAEIIIREQLDFLQVLIDTIPNPMFYKDQDGRYLGCNEAWARMHGFKREEVVGKTVYDIAPKDVADIYRLKDKELMARGGIQVYETVIIGADGQKHEVIFNKATFSKADGTIGGLVGVATDITERKRIEEALRKSEEEAKRLTQESDVVAEIGKIVSSTLDINEVYERFAVEVQKIIPFDRIAINIINPEDSTVNVSYTAGDDLPAFRPGNVYPLANSMAEMVKRTKSSFLIDVVDEEAIGKQYPVLLPTIKAGFRSLMATPLFLKDEVIGTLNFRTKKPNVYSEEIKKLAERVANQIAGAVSNAMLFAAIKRAEEEREKLIRDLQKALSEVKRLKGIFPICASCKKIRDDKGYWNQVEVYIRDHSEAEFSHGICPDCAKKLYGDI